VMAEETSGPIPSTERKALPVASRIAEGDPKRSPKRFTRTGPTCGSIFRMSEASVSFMWRVGE